LYYNYFEKNCNKYGSGHIVGMYMMFLDILGVNKEGKIKELNVLSTKYKNSAIENLLQHEITNVVNN